MAHHFLLAQLGTDLLPCLQERPLLTVLVPVQNPLVDSGGRIRCRTLDEWDARVAGKSNLVNAVREALAILTQPPSSSSSGGSAGTASTGRHKGVLGVEKLLLVTASLWARRKLPSSCSSGSMPFSWLGQWR